MVLYCGPVQPARCLFFLCDLGGAPVKRFIFVTFLFLSWSFYELSGGDNFQPRRPETQVASAAVVTAATPVVHVVSNPAPPAPRPFSAVSLVAKPAIAAKPVDPVDAALATSTPSQNTAYDEAVAAAKLDQVRSSLGQGLTMFSNADSTATPLTLASLEQDEPRADNAAGDTVSGASAPQPDWVAPPSDRREITGTRVNMRDGPGTTYPVLARLTIGQKVEVLGDSGTGWLRLRIQDGHQTGWISASLVSKAAR